MRATNRPGATALELGVWPALRRIATHLTGSRAVSAEGDTITSALGFWHGSSAVVLGSSQELMLAASGLAHTGGSTSLHAHSLGNPWEWIAPGLILRMSPSVTLELDSTSACSASGPIHSQLGSYASSPCRAPPERGNVIGPQRRGTHRCDARRWEGLAGERSTCSSRTVSSSSRNEHGQ